MLNEFNLNPVCVHEMNIADKPFISRTMVFLGDVPNDVLSAVNQVQSSKKLPENTTLHRYYGSNWKHKLGFITNEKSFEGGDVDDILDLGDELDQIDLFDVDDDKSETETEEPILAHKNIKKESKKDTKKESKKDVFKSEVTSRELIFYSNPIYPEDKISEFKEKLFIASGIQPYKQHLFFMLRDNPIPLRYKVTIDGATIPINIVKQFQNDETIKGIPVDRRIYESRDSIKIEAYDQFFTMSDIYHKYATTTYYLFNVDMFIKNKELVEEILSDNYQLELLYYSFIMMYWPQMTLDVFKIYLKSSNEMSEIYPDLAPSKNLLQQIYETQNKILSEKYKLLLDADNGYKKNPKFKEYNPEFITKSGVGKALTVSIKNATLVVEKERQYVRTQFGISIASQIKIDVRNLFDKMRITDDIPLIKVKLLRGRSPFVLTKTRDPNIVGGENIRAIFEQVKYQLQMPYWNTILFVVRAKDSQGKPISSTLTSKYLIIILYDNGKYQIKSFWSEDEQMDFKKIDIIMQKSTAPVIDTINSLGRFVFASSERLNKITQLNSEFSELSMSLFWKKTLSINQFKKVLDNLSNDFKANIIKPKESEAGLHEYLYFKGITGYDISQIEKYISLQNYYTYLSDANVKQKWISLFDQGRVVSFTHRTSDIKIEIQNIRETEFKYFYHYITSFLYNSDTTATDTAKLDIKPGVKINTLKLLKSKDPEAFIFKKYGSDVVYSRICQKDHQPIPFTPDELNLLSADEQARAVKFINYTTNNDIYYLCRKGKYPYLSFITGQHPKNYCLPCCKKTPAYSSGFSISKTPTTWDEESTFKKGTKSDDDDDENKKARVYKSCLEKHEYIEQDEEYGSSRYVMNYGKDIYIGRIGKLPDSIQQYLLYNLENVDILSEFTIARTFIMDGKKYSVDRLFKITKNIKIHKVPTKDLLIQLTNKSWEYKHEGNADISPIDVIENPKKNRKYTKHYNRIINADMQYPILVYQDKEELDPSKHVIIVDGLHRLSRAYIEKHPNINVRYITNKQLEKVYITDIDDTKKKNKDESVEKTPAIISTTKRINRTKKIKRMVKNFQKIDGSFEDECPDCGEKILGGSIDEKKPGYYLYGVPQNNRNVQNIGVLYSLAVALNMEFEEFITFTLKILKENNNYFQILLNGELGRYFSDVKELITLITDNFLRNTIFTGNAQFTRWNELFIDIARICYDKTVIIFDDTSIITTGTSMKVSVNDDVNLILPNQVRYLEDIIPSATVKNYILLLQRRKKSKSAFEKTEKVYYPIFIFVPYIFFKSHNIEKRVYTQHDEIIKLIKNMVESSLEEAPHVITEIDFNILLEFMNISKEFSVKKLFINSKDMCYAVLLNLGKEQVYVPIKYSYYNNADEFYDMLDYDVFNRNDYKLTPHALKTFIEKYNKFVVKKSISLNMIKTIDAGTKDEDRVLPIYPLLKMTKILVLSDNPGKIRGSEYTIVGLTDGTKQYYLNTNIKEFMHVFASGYNIFYNLDLKQINDNNFQYLYYDPSVVNKVVLSESKDITDNRSKLIGNAIYAKYLYRMFVLEFIRYFDKDRNEPIRKKIYSLISKTSFKGELDKFKDELENILEHYPDDAAKIREQITVFINTYFDKQTLLKEIKTSIYRFDRTSLVKIMDSTDGYWTNDISTQTQKKKHIQDELHKIAKSFIKFGEGKTDGYINILTSCEDNDSMYCSGKKLLVPSNKYDDYIELFAEDLLNPLKSPYIMALIYMENVIDEFKFENVPGEQIFIKI